MRGLIRDPGPQGLEACVLPDRASRALPIQLLLAAAVAGLAYVVVIHLSGRASAGIAAVVSSPLYFFGVTTALAASLWAAWLLEIEPTSRSRAPFRIVMWAAILFRLIGLAAPPVLSDDIHRYLWDGHVQRHGINPYAHAPADPALDALSTPGRGRINNPELPTIYPPVSQAVFLLVSFAPAGDISMKVVLILFDLGTLLVLARILSHRGQSPARVVIYAWSPLAVIEVGWSGHVDPVGVFLLVSAALAVIKKRSWLSMTLGALSGAAKYAGWLGMAPFVRRAGRRAFLAAPAAVALVYAPYAATGPDVVGSLPAYAERWRFNDSIFTLVLELVERLRLDTLARKALLAAGGLDPSARPGDSLWLRLTEPLSLAKMLVGALFLAYAVRILRRGWDDPIRESFALLAGALILSPTLHPWYLLWILPFVALVPRLSWIWLSGAVLLFSYPDLITRGPSEAPLRWLAWVEYVPFFVILGVESARRRLWERDAVTPSGPLRAGVSAAQR